MSKPDTTFKVGDKVERLGQDGTVAYVGTVAAVYPGGAVSVREHTGAMLAPPLSALRHAVKPKQSKKDREIQQLKDELAYGVDALKTVTAECEKLTADYGRSQAQLAEFKRLYGRASKTIGELRNALARKSQHVYERNVSIGYLTEQNERLREQLAEHAPESVKLVTVGAQWDVAYPDEPSLPTGSQVEDRDEDVWTLREDGKWKHPNYYPREWSELLDDYHPLTLVRLGTEPGEG